MTDSATETRTGHAARFAVSADIATLQTARLTLRPLALADAEWISRESGRPEVANNLALVPAPNPALFAEMFILTVRAKPADIVRAVIDRERGEPIGVVGAHHKGRGRVRLRLLVRRLRMGPRRRHGGWRGPHRSSARGRRGAPDRRLFHHQPGIGPRA